MPFYDYKCEKCGHQFEAMRSMQERNDPIQCPNCGEMITTGQKIGGGQAWVLKGDGWGPRYWSEYNRQREAFRRKKQRE